MKCNFSSTGTVRQLVQHKQLGTCSCSNHIIQVLVHISLISIQPVAYMFQSCSTISTLTVPWVAAAQASRSKTCNLLQQQIGLSVEQHQIYLREGGEELLLAVRATQVSGFPENCKYWMMNEQWNCSNIYLPAFQKTASKGQDTGCTSVSQRVHAIYKCTA